jgi:hypothetical protein
MSKKALYKLTYRKMKRLFYLGQDDGECDIKARRHRSFNLLHETSGKRRVLHAKRYNESGIPEKFGTLANSSGR